MPAQRKRVKHYDELGHARFLTFSCFRRLPLLSKERTCLWFLAALAEARQKHGFKLWAWVIMPEHIHLLLWPQPPHLRLADILSSIKQPVARRAIAYLRKSAPAYLPRLLDQQPSGRASHRFWQRGPGYDLNLWEPAKVWDKIDYLHGNPQRRGLCDRPEEWRWSSAADHLRLRSAPVELDWDTLPPDPRPAK